MTKIKIAAVSYLNSVPFIYGINESGAIDAELILAPPAECARMLREGEVEVALTPVAALPSLGVGEEDGARIITSHCIGSVGAVRSVALLSDEPLDQIQRIWLDTESQTSIKLLAHLCENHFKITPQWHMLSDVERLAHPKDGDAFLLIGDKVFEQEEVFEYTVDLALEWNKATSLPFAFAVWCARDNVEESVEEELEEALTWGVEHAFEALSALRSDVEMEEGYRYLTENIDTLFDNAKRQAMEVFLHSTSKIVLSYDNNISQAVQ